MGAIRTAADHAYRDYRVPGDNRSRTHTPEKPAIKALFGLVEDAIGTGGGGAIDPVERPGDAPDLFTGSTVGDGSSLSSPPAGVANDNVDGAAWRTSGAATVATRRNLPLEAGVTYVVRWAARRATDPLDPLGDAVEYNIAWLDANKALISTQVVNSASLVIASGLLTVSKTVSRDMAADITTPAGARYMRPFVKTYGAAGTLTDIEVIDAWRSNGTPGPAGNDGDLTPEAEALRDEMLTLKADTLAAVGKKFGLNVLDFGADNTGVGLTQDEVQAALNAAGAAGGGIVFAPAGEYLIGDSAETYPSTYCPEGDSWYGLLIPAGVVLVGEGRATHFKRAVANPLMMFIAPNGDGTQVRNLRIDGNATTYPYVGDTFGSGGGIGVESTSVTFDRETVVDTVWIEDTPGYGIGVEWGNHRGCTLRNIFIDGTGSDGIDIKRMNSGAFDAYAITLDNIHVTNFGRTATDVATQAGVDIRGFVTATNIHVRGVWGDRASAGIRMHATGGGVIGGHFASVSNFYVDRDSGGQPSTYGILNNGAEFGSFSNGSVRGCHYNLTAVGPYALFSAVRSNQAILVGLSITDDATSALISGCADYLSPNSVYISGDRCTIHGLVTLNNGSGGDRHITIAATSDNAFISGHVPGGTNGNIVNDLGTNTRNSSYYT